MIEPILSVERYLHLCTLYDLYILGETRGAEKRQICNVVP